MSDKKQKKKTPDARLDNDYARMRGLSAAEYEQARDRAWRAFKAKGQAGWEKSRRRYNAGAAGSVAAFPDAKLGVDPETGVEDYGTTYAELPQADPLDQAARGGSRFNLTPPNTKVFLSDGRLPSTAAHEQQHVRDFHPGEQYRKIPIGPTPTAQTEREKTLAVADNERARKYAALNDFDRNLYRLFKFSEDRRQGGHEKQIAYDTYPAEERYHRDDVKLGKRLEVDQDALRRVNAMLADIRKADNASGRISPLHAATLKKATELDRSVRMTQAALAKAAERRQIQFDAKAKAEAKKAPAAPSTPARITSALQALTEIETAKKKKK